EERRRRADHLLEVVVADAARPVRIDDDMHHARGVEVRLLDDPAPETGRLFPVDVAEGIAADVLAERVDLGARAGAVRVALFADHGTETLARAGVVEEAGEDDHLSADLHAPLLEEKAERI